MTLGEKISTLRKSKGISQEALAEQCGISLRTVQRIESGDSLPRPYTIKAMADVLEIPVGTLSALSSAATVSTREEMVMLRQINFAGLAALVLPLGNIILSWWLWRRHRNLPLVDEVGRKIVSFQILWTAATLLLLISSQLIQASITNSVAIGHLPPIFVIVYFVLLVVNFLIVLQAAFRLSRENVAIYSFVPALI